MSNPVIYFEIPATDLQRARNFYKNVFDFNFEDETIDGYNMTFFPFNESEKGISGALVKGDIYKPTINGVILYFNTDDIDITLKNVEEQKGIIMYPKTYNKKYNFYVAEFQDSEGNRIALQQFLD